MKHFSTQSLSILFSTVAVAGLVACSSGSGSGGVANVDTSTIAAVPKATGAVNGTAAKILEAIRQETPLDSRNTVLATTGLALKSWGKASQWTAAKSRGMCETGLLMRDALSEAMNPDKIGCYVGSIQKAGGFGATTIDSGEYLYFKLNNLPGEGNAIPRIKMKVVKTSGVITQFEMFSCFGGGGTTQSEYLNAVISNGTGTVSSKHIGSEGSENYGGKVTTTGSLDNNYRWNSKDIVLERFWNAGANGSYSQKASINQKTTTFTVSGYNTGTYGSGASTNRFTNKFYTVVEGLNMTTPKNLALGDGSSKYSMDWCIDSNSSSSCDGGDSSVFNSTSSDSWNGDDLSRLGTASDGTYYALANAGTIPTSTPAVTVTFEAGETWDCNATSFIDVDVSQFETPGSTLGNLVATCEANFSYQNDNDATDTYPCGDAR